MTHALTTAPLSAHPDLIATVADRIWRAWWQDSDTSLQALTAELAKIAAGTSVPQAIVALKGGRYAGSALLIESDEDDFPYLTPWIAAVWTEPEFRGQGVATAVMAALRDRAKASGVDRVYLTARAEKIPFYERLGYQLMVQKPGGAGIFTYPLHHQTRRDRPEDASAIARLTTAAFAEAPHSSGTEAAIVDALRRDGALALSLVVEGAIGEIIGHIAFSPVTISGSATGWVGLGPVSVAPEYQGKGIGAGLIALGLDWIRAQGAKGCVVLGDPAYYARFGFAPDPSLRYPGPPPEYFQALSFSEGAPSGVVSYAPAFG